MTTFSILMKILPYDICRKILIFFIGFGTPSANLLKSVLMEMKKFSFDNMDDYTVWRYNILKRDNTETLMMKPYIFSSHKWGCIYELDRAYISSVICDNPEHIKFARQIACDDADELQLLITITNLTYRPNPIIGTPSACIIHQKIQEYKIYLDELYGLD
jgi:hypothetical protein